MITAALAPLDDVADVWERHGDLIVAAAGVTAVLVAAAVVVAFARSTRKDRWLDLLAAVVVLGWTSEGMWEVATEELGFPIAFAGVTFFVAETMMLASAKRADEHRRRYGVPGPSGYFVWVLAGSFGLGISLFAETTGERFLRIALPLLAAGLWWTGLTAERDTDTHEMREARRRRAAEREATWAITPRTLLVQWGVMKAGNVTTTDAQREHQLRRMVIHAHKAAVGGPLTGLRRYRLQVLTRTADDGMIQEVAVRAARALQAEHLMIPRPHPETRPDGLPDGTEGPLPDGARVPSPDGGKPRLDDRPDGAGGPSPDGGGGSSGRPRTSRRRPTQTGPGRAGGRGRRTRPDDELIKNLEEAINNKILPGAPTAEAIRDHLRINRQRAAKLRDMLPPPPPVPLRVAPAPSSGTAAEEEEEAKEGPLRAQARTRGTSDPAKSDTSAGVAVGEGGG